MPLSEDEEDMLSKQIGRILGDPKFLVLLFLHSSGAIHRVCHIPSPSVLHADGRGMSGTLPSSSGGGVYNQHGKERAWEHRHGCALVGVKSTQSALKCSQSRSPRYFYTCIFIFP